jgi:type III restriction enzyme
VIGFEVPDPKLNSPYEEPNAHWRIVEGEPAEQVPGRRPALYYYRPAGQAAVEAGVRTAIELKLVNRIRERVKAWLDQGYPGVTRTTLASQRLLNQGSPKSHNWRSIPPVHWWY